jgi:hypothetical protein
MVHWAYFSSTEATDSVEFHCEGLCRYANTSIPQQESLHAVQSLSLWQHDVIKSCLMLPPMQPSGPGNIASAT